ncbi:MAG: hypothetical protein ACI8RD_010332 [Bacillariaceae sp.]|jgi:hypothetical protein
MMVLDRVKYQLGYPEAAKDMLSSKSLLTAVEQYSMGTERPLSQYLDLVGLDMTTKEVTMTQWCETGQVRFSLLFSLKYICASIYFISISHRLNLRHVLHSHLPALNSLIISTSNDNQDILLVYSHFIIILDVVISKIFT